MGLNALVRCNCWKEGRIAPPPVPLGLIYEDQAGYLDLRGCLESLYLRMIPVVYRKEASPCRASPIRPI